MHRLRCGIIYTNAFAEYLATLSQEGTRVKDKILSLEYLRCTSGEKAGAEWWNVQWMPAHRVPEECRFTIGTLPVGLSRQSQRGLKDRCIDCRDGQVIIR
jgi:hypothetical protein